MRREAIHSFEVPNEAGVADDAPNVDGMTGSGDRGSSVGGETAILQMTITRPNIMGRSSTKRSECNPEEVVAYSLRVLSDINLYVECESVWPRRTSEPVSE